MITKKHILDIEQESPDIVLRSIAVAKILIICHRCPWNMIIEQIIKY